MLRDEETLILNYREEAPFFDPLNHKYNDTEEETIGGRGIMLILGLSINTSFYEMILGIAYA